MTHDDIQQFSPTMSDPVRPSPTSSDNVRPRPTMSATRSEAHTLTTREVMKIFEEEGVPRAQRSIERYCQEGHLDCMPDAVEKRLYITRTSVDILIGQLKEIASRHEKTQDNTDQQTAATDDDDRQRQGTKDSSMKRSTPEKQDDKHHAGEYEEQVAAMSARIKELENEKFNLEITKRASEQVVGILREQMSQQTQLFSTELSQQSRRVGQLETEMRQLTAPRNDRLPTRDDNRSDDDGGVKEAEFSEASAAEHEPSPNVSLNNQPQP